MRVTVDEEELSKAIGRRGQNARLTSRLIGWDVQVEKDESAHEAFEARVADAAKTLAGKIGIEKEQAMGLVRGGINSLEMLASDVEAVDVAEILDISEEEGAAILAKAQAAFGNTPKPAEPAEPIAEEPAEPIAEEAVAADSSEEVAEENAEPAVAGSEPKLD